PAAAAGIRSMPQIGQDPGSGCMICGCMEQVHIWSDAASVPWSCSSIMVVSELPPNIKYPINNPIATATPMYMMFFFFMTLFFFVLQSFNHFFHFSNFPSLGLNDFLCQFLYLWVFD